MKIPHAFAALLLVTAPVLAQSGQEGAPVLADSFGAKTGTVRAPRFAEAIARATEALVRGMEENHLPGVSIAVGVDGELVWAEGFGFADLENGVPVTPASRFRVGSVSKPLTAFGLALLVEEGRLDLDAPIQKYLPDYPVKEEGEITTRLLAGHLAGIRHYRGTEFLNATWYPTVQDGLAIFKDDPLLSDPGTRFSYSSYGWNLVSAVMEAASGQEFLAFMASRVFEPLGMESTVPDRNRDVVPGRVRFYDLGPDQEFVNSPYVDNSYKWAGGGFLSTPTDLVKFGLAHLRPRLLKPETVAMLFTSQKTTGGEETGYGIGWFIQEDDQGRRVIQHGGGSVGGTTRLVLYPDAGAVMAATVNLSRARYPAFREVVSAFLP